MSSFKQEMYENINVFGTICFKENIHKQGLDVQEWGCSIAWIPLLLVENSQQTMIEQNATDLTKQWQVCYEKSISSASNLLRNGTSIP